MNTRSKAILKAVLLVLLFTVQALSHAHSVDHVLDGNSGFCSICSVTGHGGDAIVDSDGAEVEIPLQRTVPACRNHTIPFAEDRRPSARAPPLS
ncbi:MAG: hypothetical protein V2I48_07490 [Xanthomonadales bacterium]|jgi:hypothetical protein|nr:hypothetical protein [Xanthomonadales bacterium]